jgi:hypothetical protein
VGAFIILSILICYPLLKDTDLPTKGLENVQKSRLDDQSIEFVKKVYGEEVYEDMVTRIQWMEIPSKESSKKQQKPEHDITKVDSMHLIMLQIQKQIDEGKVDVEKLPFWTFDEFLNSKEAFLTKEPLSMTPSEYKQFKNAVQKHKSSKMMSGASTKVTVASTAAPKDKDLVSKNKDGEIELADTMPSAPGGGGKGNKSQASTAAATPKLVPLTKEELEEQSRIKKQQQENKVLEEEMSAEKRDDAYGFVVRSLKLKGARGRAISGKLKEMGFNSKSKLGTFDNKTMTDSELKTDFGMTAVEVRKFREACMKQRRINDGEEEDDEKDLAGASDDEKGGEGGNESDDMFVDDGPGVNTADKKKLLTSSSSSSSPSAVPKSLGAKAASMMDRGSSGLAAQPLAKAGSIKDTRGRIDATQQKPKKAASMLETSSSSSSSSSSATGTTANKSPMKKAPPPPGGQKSVTASSTFTSMREPATVPLVDKKEGGGGLVGSPPLKKSSSTMGDKSPSKLREKFEASNAAKKKDSISEVPSSEAAADDSAKKEKEEKESGRAKSPGPAGPAAAGGKGGGKGGVKAFAKKGTRAESKSPPRGQGTSLDEQGSSLDGTVL